jgi:hypothetical protein
MSANGVISAVSTLRLLLLVFPELTGRRKRRRDGSFRPKRLAEPWNWVDTRWYCRWTFRIRPT